MLFYEPISYKLHKFESLFDPLNNAGWWDLPPTGLFYFYEVLPVYYLCGNRSEVLKIDS
jgi:hypothetical protein